MHFIEKSYRVPCCIQFWQNKFNIEITEWNWLIVRKSTKESRLIELHWKILHNIYPTNIVLYKMGIVPNTKCFYCKDKTDFIEHFFFECNKISHIWKLVAQQIYKKHNIKVKLEAVNVLLGFNSDTYSDMIVRYINLLIIIAKMCIGKYRYGTPLDISILERELDLRGLS